VTLSYFPLAHMVWGGGFLSGLDESGLASRLFGWAGDVANVSPVDYAGGTVVHINAGVAGLVLVLLIGARKGFAREPMRPHNLPFTMLGAGLLWFGWFGFNVGSIVPVATQGVAGDEADFFKNSAAFAQNFVGETGLVWVNTFVATCAAMLAWLLVERLRDGKATSLGAASGVVAGLVAITPACGSLSPVGSIVLGAAAGVLCALAVGLKYRFGYDDSLDVVGVHLVGGLVGTIGVGFLATSGGLFYGDGLKQLVVQTLVALSAMVWSGVFTLVVGLVVKATVGWRVTDEDEVEGVDFAQHGETAYEFASLAGTRAGRLPSVSAAQQADVEARGVNA
jgi:ammonium transporter, Amt family